MPSTSKILDLFLLSFWFLSAKCHPADGHVCDHDEVEQNPQFADIEEDFSVMNGERVLTEYPNIRIYPYFGFLENSAPTEYVSYIKNEVVPPVIDYYQAALKVKYPALLGVFLGTQLRQICGQPVPSILSNPGVNADFFIYYDSYSKNDSKIASSKYCVLSTGTKRPIVARTVLNRLLVPIANQDMIFHEKNMYVIIHELMHTLGFSTNLYMYFLDEAGRPRSGHIKTLRIAGYTRTVIDVPPLTEKLRTFFGCPDLQGAIMENGGGSGTSASHFERRYFVYEMMSSGSIAGRRISEFSLALLEGSGWYIPDYSYAEPYFYGQGQGCPFVTNSCSETTVEFEEFCLGTGRGCAPHGRGAGTCFGDSNMEGCKYYYPYEEYDCEEEKGSWFASRLADLQSFGRGAGSKCFTGDLNIRAGQGPTTFCFKYTCSGEGLSTQVEVQIGAKKITCTKAEKKALDGFYGSIDCPDPLAFCNTIGKKYCPRNCMGRGTCVDNVCQCKPGFTGVDCASKI